MQYLLVFFVSMVPLVELRLAVPMAVGMGLPYWPSLIICVLGNMIPVPAIILFIRSIFRFLRKNPWWEGKISRLEQRAHLKGQMVRKYRIPGLIILVAIPLPGTGAWTGALVAALLDIRFQSALPAILLGVIIAGGIVTAASCGVISLWF